MTLINETHDPAFSTWVSADAADSASYPIQNLPFGRFSIAGGAPRVGVAIGDCVVDLATACERRLLGESSAALILSCHEGWLNPLMAAGNSAASRLRRELSALLRIGAKQSEATRECLHVRSDVQMLMPVDVRNYSDFYTSYFHADNGGKARRPEHVVAANFHSLPNAYHGRASTLCSSGTDFRRPHGQARDARTGAVLYRPTQALDFECELAIYVGRGNLMGDTVALADAPDALFGLSLLNDWSARDVQAWESTPLGPFLAKSFISSVSPWVVTLEALAPFRVAAATRLPYAPALLPYLDDPKDRASGGLDITLEILIQTRAMRAANLEPHVISRPRFKDQYWTIFQMLAHYASNGCQIVPGDLLGSGTISGPAREELGCLLEITQAGKSAFSLPTGEERTYLEDGDQVILSARCEKDGFVSIGFGTCCGTVLPPLA